MSKLNRLIQYHNSSLKTVKCTKNSVNHRENLQTKNITQKSVYSLDKPTTSSMAEDIALGSTISAAILCLAIILFHLDMFGAAFGIFACSYIIFFYHLCQAGTKEAPRVPYVSGTSWLRQQQQRSKPRIKPRYTATATPYRSSTLIDDSAIFDLSNDSMFDMPSHSPFSRLKFDDITQTETPWVNPATGLSMQGAFDSAGNAFGTDNLSNNDMLVSNIDDFNPNNTFSIDDSTMFEESNNEW